MTVKKTWETHRGINFAGYRYKYTYTGWFLFGFIPLYIDRVQNY